MRDVPAGGTVAGYPAADARQAMREVTSLRKLPALMQRLNRLLKAESSETRVG